MDILVIDPDRGIQNYYRNLLESEFRSVQVHFVLNSEEAARYLGTERPDLILCEILQHEDGLFDFLGGLVRRNIPVIIVSENYSERLIVECLRAGALDFLSKRFIKLGILPLLIKRALLEGDRWSKIQEYALGIMHRPEYVALNRKIQGFLKTEESERSRRNISRGIRTRDFTYTEGQTYRVVFLYLQVATPPELASMEINRLSVLRQKILTSAVEIAEKYGGQAWTLKEDGCFFAFDGDAALEGVLAAIHIHASMNVFYLTLENVSHPPPLNMGLARGQTVYRSNKGEIYSEALNLSAHMAIYAKGAHQIMITDELYQSLGSRAQKYFFRTDPFEAVACYLYEPIA